MPRREWSPQAAQGQGELIVEKFLEDQANLRGTAVVVKQLDALVLRREVRIEQGFAPRGEAIAFENLRRERFGNIAVEIGEHAVDDAAQHARADGADGFVDGDDAADFGGIGGAAFGGAYEFHLGVDHFQAARAVAVFVHFSVQD